jgi:hypothetical protein
VTVSTPLTFMSLWRRKTYTAGKLIDITNISLYGGRLHFLSCGKTVNMAETKASKRWRNKITYNLLWVLDRLRLKCDVTRAETRYRLSAKRTSPFKSTGASVQSTTGRRAVHISLQGLHCSCKAVFCSHVMLTGYPLHSLVSPSLLLPCVTVCHHISNAVYQTL